MIRPLSLYVSLTMLCGGWAQAHLCDNVFAQARDNLVVKVDVRDGQLRIGREASFRVYLLNTMDRDIVEIALDIDSSQFEAQVSPGPGWSNHPQLRTAAKGGKKEYFTVHLRRKPDVPDGAYKIGLNLVSRRQKMSFMSIDLDAAADVAAIPKTAGIVLDGKASREEWGDSFLSANFHAYRRVGRYHENVTVEDQTRVRVVYDDTHMYFLAAFHGGADAGQDTVSIHLAPTPDDTPVVVTVDRRSGAVTDAEGNPVAGAKAVPSAEGDLVEGRIPRAGIGLAGVNRFHMNFTRSIMRQDKQETTYWRGNNLSLAQPIVYGQFTLAP